VLPQRPLPSAICRFYISGAPAIIFMMPTTGPRSQSGKAVSKRNASKHGILSDAPVVVLIDEDPREWERHRVGTIESLNAEGHIEIVIAERIANLFLAAQAPRTLRDRNDHLGSQSRSRPHRVYRESHQGAGGLPERAGPHV